MGTTLQIVGLFYGDWVCPFPITYAVLTFVSNLIILFFVKRMEDENSNIHNPIERTFCTWKFNGITMLHIIIMLLVIIVLKK